jgi:hypothetical protein
MRISPQFALEPAEKGVLWKNVAFAERLNIDLRKAGLK